MNELELIVEGEVLDLLPGTSIGMVFNNSLLDTEVIQGSYSLPFNLPDTPKNRRVLKFPEIIESLDDLETKYSCQLRYEVLVINATLSIRDVLSSGGYSVNLFTDIGAIAEKMRSAKLNELDLERISLPIETRPWVTTSFEVSDSIAIDTILTFKVFRQDFSTVWFPVKWAGTLSQYLTDLMARIKNPRPSVPMWNSSAVYSLYDIVKDADGNYWDAQYAGLTGRVPKISTIYDEFEPYVAEDLVIDFDTSFVYQAILPSTGVSLSNTTYWEFIGLNDPWRFISNTAGWPAAWRSGTVLKWHLYDDPVYEFNLDADVLDSTLYVYDLSGFTGALLLDYILIWTQTITGLALTAGSQNVEGTIGESNFRLTINRMLSGQLGKQWPDTNFVFLPYYNPGSFDDSLLDPDAPTRPYVNYFIDGEYKYGNTLSDVTKQFISPQVAVCYVLKKIFEELGVNYDGSLLEGSAEHFDFLHIYNSRAAVKLVRVPGGNGFLTFPFEINLAEHLPAITLSEFINAFRQFFFLGFVFDSGSKSFKVVRLKDVLNTPAIDWTDKADPQYKISRDNPEGFLLSYTNDSNDGKVKLNLPDISKYQVNATVPDLASLPLDIAEVNRLRYVEEKESFYLAAWSSDNVVVWNFHSRYLQPLKIGEGKTVRKPGISTVLDERLVDLSGFEFDITRNWQVPGVDQKLAIPDMAIDSPFTLRVLFNWGLQPDSNGDDYPYGSPQNRNYSGTVLGPMSLRYDGTTGVVEMLGKEWLAFLQSTKKVFRDVRMTSKDVATLTQDQPIRVDRVDYLWKTFKISLPIPKNPNWKGANFELWKK